MRSIVIISILLSSTMCLSQDKKEVVPLNYKLDYGDPSYSGRDKIITEPPFLRAWYQDYNQRTGQLKREGLFKKGKFINGWIFVYPNDTTSQCSKKIEIKDRKRVKEIACEKGEGKRIVRNK